MNEVTKENDNHEVLDDDFRKNVSIEFRKKLEEICLTRRSSEIAEDFEQYMKYIDKDNYIENQKFKDEFEEK